MLTLRIRNEDGSIDPGPYDIIGIMKDVSTGRFHATMWWEHPMPGVHDPNPTLVRLKSKGHHTTGAGTYEGAVQHAQELRLKFKVEDANFWINPERVVERDFETDGFASVLILPNWLNPNTRGAHHGKHAAAHV